MTAEELRNLAETVEWAEDRARMLGRKEARIIMAEGDQSDAMIDALACEAVLAHRLPDALALLFTEALWLEVGRLMALKEGRTT
jgi:hypothetical protein